MKKSSMLIGLGMTVLIGLSGVTNASAETLSQKTLSTSQNKELNTIKKGTLKHQLDNVLENHPNNRAIDVIYSSTKGERYYVKNMDGRIFSDESGTKLGNSTVNLPTTTGKYVLKDGEIYKVKGTKKTLYTGNIVIEPKDKVLEAYKNGKYKKHYIMVNHGSVLSLKTEEYVVLKKGSSKKTTYSPSSAKVELGVRVQKTSNLQLAKTSITKGGSLAYSEDNSLVSTKVKFSEGDKWKTVYTLKNGTLYNSTGKTLVSKTIDVGISGSTDISGLGTYDTENNKVTFKKGKVTKYERTIVKYSLIPSIK